MAKLKIKIRNYCFVAQWERSICLAFGVSRNRALARMLLLIIVSGMYFFSIPSVFSSTRSEMFSTQAALLLHDGKYSQALVKLTRAIADDPQDVKARYYHGIANSRLGNYDEAITDFRKVRESGEKFSGLPFDIGYAYYRNKQFGPALDSLSTAVENNLGNASVHYYLGLANFQQKNYVESMAPFQLAAKLDLAYGASTSYLVGSAYYQLKDLDKAKEILVAGIAQYPESSYYNSSQELIKRIDIKQGGGKRYRVDFDAGTTHDSNVGLFPNEDIPNTLSNKSDNRSHLNLGAGFKVFSQDNMDLEVGFRLYKTSHQKLKEFELSNNSLFVDFRDRRDTVTSSLRYDITQADLNGVNYLKSQTLSPTVLFNHEQENRSMVRGQLRDTDYYLADDLLRSSYYYEFHYRYYQVSQSESEGTIYYGAKINKEDAIDNDYDYSGYGTEIGYQSNLGKGAFTGSLRYDTRTYDKEPNERDNKYAEWSIKYLYPISSGVGIETSVVHINNQSNLALYKYDRSLVSATLRWQI
jgi:tetratricopeptide (TPR) repeat protein